MTSNFQLCFMLIVLISTISCSNTIDTSLNGAAVPLVRYVRTTGDDTTGDGSATQPYKTITKAISSIPSATTAEIAVAAGTYSINTAISLVEGISIKGGYSATNWDDRRYVTIADRDNASYQTVIIYEGSEDTSSVLTSATAISVNTVIEGLYLKAKQSVGTTNVYAISLSASSSPTIRYNTIDGGKSSFLAIGINVDASSPVIFGNKIIGGEVSSGASNNALVENIKCATGSICTIESNELNGGSVSGSGTLPISHVIYNDKSVIIVKNNKIQLGSSTVSGNKAAQVYGLYSIGLTSYPISIYNNLIYGGTASSTLGTVDVVSISNYSDETFTATISNNTISTGYVPLGGATRRVTAITSSGKPLNSYDNNIIYCALSSASGYYGIMDSSVAMAHPTSLTNNDFYSCSTVWFMDVDGSYTNIGTINSRSYAIGNINVDPNFTNASGSDFTLLTSNVANLNVRGGGKNLSGSFTTDIIGTARTTSTPTGMSNNNAAGWSMGAYEAD